MIVYLPVSVEEAVRLRDGDTLPHRVGFAATQELLDAAGFGPRDAEDAGYTALSHAGVAAVLAEPGEQRLVLAAGLETITDLDDPYGAVRVSDLSWDRVWALYYDEPEAAPAVRKATAAVGPTESVADALTHPEVGALLDDHDLLWYDPTELDQLT